MSRESKLLSLVLLIVMLCTCCLPSFAEEKGSGAASGANVPDSYRLIGENSRFNVYLQDADMALAIERKDTGDVMFSTVQNAKKGSGTWAGMQFSGVVIEYLQDVQDKPLQADFVNSAYTITYTDLENGFIAHISFTDLGISFDVSVEINEAGLTVAMDPDSIVETKDETYMIVRNDRGREERVELARYNAKKLADREKSEFILKTSDGASYKVVETGVVMKNGKLTVKNNEGTTSALPFDSGVTPVYEAKTRDGKTYAVPAELIAGMDASGNAYLRSDCMIVSVAGNGAKDCLPIVQENGAYLPLESVTSITRKPYTIPVADMNGVAKNINAYDVTEVIQNVYITATAKDGSELRYPKDKVVMISDISYTFASIYLYPFMGYSQAGVGQGYMIIPDGQGAIVGFENNEKRYTTPYDKQVYGLNIGVDNQFYSQSRVQAEDVLAPFFGMVHTDKGIAVLGVIEEGDIAARIIAYPNGVRNLNYDWVTAKYTYRFVFQQPMGPGSANVATRNEHRRDFKVKQHFLLECGDTADYAGLAVAYRNHLISANAFAEAEDRPFDFQLDFLGMERENFILGKKDVPMTTFQQAGQILDELLKEGVETGDGKEKLTVDNLSVVYRGWQTDGLTGGVPTDSFSPAGSLGGKNALNTLRLKAQELNVPFALETDFLSLNTETHPTLTFSAFKRITSQTWQRATFGKVYATLNYLNPVSSRDIGVSLIDQMNDADMQSVAFTGITQLLSDYYHQNKYHDTSEMVAYYTEIIGKANETMATNLVSPNAYLWEYAGVISDLPIAGSDYTYTDAEIPFLTIALSGQIPYYVEYANFQANTREFFLHVMEQGARPSFLLTMEDPIKLQNTNSSDIYSSRYDLYKELIVEWYAELKQLHDIVGTDGMIVDHVRSGDMVCVTWSNGTKVYLNFGDFEGTMDDVTLQKLSYQIKEVNGNGN